MITAEKRFWSILNNGVEFISGIGLIVFITRRYSPSETGTWFLFIAVFGLAGALRDALIQSAMVKHSTTGSREDHITSLKSNFIVMMLFEIITSAIIIVAAIFVKNTTAQLLLFYPFYSLPSAWYRWQTFYLRSQLEVKSIFISNAASLAVMVIGAMIIYVTSSPIKDLIIVLGASSLAGLQVVMHKVPYGALLRASPNQASFHSIKVLGVYGMLREATSAISSRIGLFYTSALLSLRETAMLGLSQRFAQISLLPNNAFQSILFPTLMRQVNEGNFPEARKTFEHSIAQLLAITIPFALFGVVLSPFLLTLVGGNEYQNAWPILTIYLLLSTILTPFGTAFGSLLTALGKPHVAFRVVLLNSILNTTLGFLLMKWLGLPGVPIALALTEIFGFVLIGRIVKSEAGISFLNTFTMIPSVYAKMLTHLRAYFVKSGIILEPQQKKL